MLEIVREFAREQLAASAEAATMARRHADFFAGLAERCEREYFSAEQVVWVRRCLEEVGNLRAALAWSAGADGDPAPGLRLAAALWWFWWLRGSRVPGQGQSQPVASGEGRRWIDRGLAHGAGIPPSVRARACTTMGLLAIVEDHGDKHDALATLEESVALARAAADPFTLARAQFFLGYGCLVSGNAEAAACPLEEALAGFQAPDVPPWKGVALWLLAEAAALTGDDARAQALADAALALCRQSGLEPAEALTLGRLGMLALRRGDPAEAERCFRQALALHLARADWHPAAVEVVSLAHVAWIRGEPARAARLAGAAAALFAAVGAEVAEALHGTTRQDGLDYERLIANLRATLGDERFAAEWAAGHRPTPEDAVAVALAEPGVEPPSASVSPAVADPTEGLRLTPREVEVLRLLAQGRSNREIGEALFISPRTVNFHVTNLLAKLELDSRAAAAAFAVRRGWA